MKYNIHRLYLPTIIIMACALFSCSDDTEGDPNCPPRQPLKLNTLDVMIEDENGVNLLNNIDGQPSLLHQKLKFDDRYSKPADPNYGCVEIDGYNKVLDFEGCHAYSIFYEWPDMEPEAYFYPDEQCGESRACKYNPDIKHAVNFIIRYQTRPVNQLCGFTIYWEEGQKEWCVKLKSVAHEDPNLVDIYINGDWITRANWYETSPRVHIVVNSDELK